MADNKIELTIAGLSIVVSTPEDEAFTRALAEEVDADIRNVMHANEGASVTSAALLCAIDYLFSQKRAEKSSANMRSQIKDYLAEAASAKLESEEERRRTLDLTAEIQTLRTQLTRLAVDSDNTITDKMKSQLAATTNELTTMRARVNELIVQNKSLNDKAAAMSGLIAQRDEEAVKLGDENAQLKSQLASRDGTIARQAQTIDELSAENRAVKEEVARLNSELDTLESMILEEERVASELKAIENLAAGETPPETTQLETGYVPYEDETPALEAQTEVEVAVETSEVVYGDDEAPEPTLETDAPFDEDEDVDEDEPEPRRAAARASLSDPVFEDDAPRPRVFDYEADLADESYEQLDVSMIADAPPDDEDDDFDEPEDDDDYDETDEDDEPLPGEPDYKLNTDDISSGRGAGVEFESFSLSESGDEGELVEMLDDETFGGDDKRIIDEMVARGADDTLAEPEERTVHVQRTFDDDGDDEPDKPDLSWTLNI